MAGSRSKDSEDGDATDLHFAHVGSHLPQPKPLEPAHVLYHAYLGAG